MLYTYTITPLAAPHEFTSWQGLYDQEVLVELAAYCDPEGGRCGPKPTQANYETFVADLTAALLGGLLPFTREYCGEKIEVTVDTTK